VRHAKLRNTASILAIYATVLHQLANLAIVVELEARTELPIGQKPASLRAIVTRARNGLHVARQALDAVEKELDSRWPRGHEPRG
jgi:hypothetical protein